MTFAPQRAGQDIAILILEKLRKAGYDNVIIDNTLATKPDVQQKYFAFKVKDYNQEYISPVEAQRATDVVVEVIADWLQADETARPVAICVCQVERIRPYNFFEDVIKGIVRYRVCGEKTDGRN